MRVLRTIPVLTATALVVAACSDHPVEPPTETTIAHDQSAASLSLDEGAARTTDNLLVVFRGSSIPARFADDVAALGGTVVHAIDAYGAASVHGVAASELAALNGVRFVEPELELQTDPIGEVEAIAAPASLAATASTTDPTQASFFPNQWHLHAIQAQDAWAAGRTGSSSVTVAILDTGIDYLHADLAGLVDLDRSISFLPQDDALLLQVFGPDVHPIADLDLHGTHVAATVSSNALAAAGVTSNVTLIGAKVCSVYGGCPGAAIFAALEHAAEHGADVVNMSLGGNFQKRDFPGYVAVVNRAMNQLNRAGVTVVVSAGNSAIDMDRDSNAFKTYCDAPNAVCVSATGPTAVTEFDDFGRAIGWADVDALATYSNYGRSAVDVAAPGGNTGGGVMAACSTFSLVLPVCGTGTYVVTMSGTSMASPHAAGVAALIVEDVGHNRPGQVRARLHQTADRIGDSGNDPRYGKGRVNAFGAIGG